MSCFVTVVRREGDDMPKVIRVPLPERSGGDAMSWTRLFNPHGDSERFERRWFEDFRAFVQRGYRSREFFRHYTPEPEAE